MGLAMTVLLHHRWQMRYPAALDGKPDAAARLEAGRLVDWHCLKQRAMGPRALAALAHALGVWSVVKPIAARLREARLEARGVPWPSIPGRIGYGKRTADGWRATPQYKEALAALREGRAVPFHLHGLGDWSDGYEAEEAAWTVGAMCRGSKGEATRYPPQEARLRLFGVLCWHAHHGRPITAVVSWSTLSALGLMDYHAGPLESTVEATNGKARFPEALEAMARIDAGVTGLTDAEMLRRLNEDGFAVGKDFVAAHRKGPGYEWRVIAARAYGKQQEGFETAHAKGTRRARKAKVITRGRAKRLHVIARDMRLVARPV